MERGYPVDLLDPETAQTFIGQVHERYAETIGEWFGSIMPPAPTRIVLVPPATWQIQTDVAALAIPARL